MRFRIQYIAILAFICLLAAVTVEAQEWKQVANPEDAGFDVTALQEARAFAEEAGSSAVMLVHRGRVIVAWGDLERPYKCHSVRKSFLSMMYGPFVEDGTIDLDKTIGELGIDDIQSLTDGEKQATIADLLASRSGIYHPAAKETGRHKRNRPARGSHAPGTHWWYNNWDFNVSGILFEMETDQGLFPAFKRMLADPLGMEDFSLEHTQYQYEPNITRHPAFSFRMSTRDRARIGQLMLQNGRWNGEQLISPEWVKRSTAGNSEYDEGYGYGYMWWTYSFPEDHHFSGMECFAASGAGGHLIIVVPEEELVFVHSTNTDFDREMDGNDVWQIFAMLRDAKTGEGTASPELTALRPVPFPTAEPELPTYSRIHLSPAFLERYTGKYKFPNGFTAEVSVFHDRLLVYIAEIGEALLVPASENEFFWPGQNISGKGILDSEGRVTALAMNIKGMKVKAERIE